MKKIVSDIIQLTDAQREGILRAASAHGYEARFCADEAQALAEAADAEILFAANPALLGVARELKWLCVPSAGVEPYIPRGLYANPDAILSNSSGAYGVTIAEHIIMVVLQMMRRQQEYAELMARRGWRRDLTVHSIRGSRVTLLGTGNIGQEAARRLRSFGPERIIGVSRTGRQASRDFDRVLPLDGLDDVLRETDLLIMSLPGTPETAGIMGLRRLALLPGDAFLVNVGRGSAIDQKALKALMDEGHLSGAALDVFETEPLPPEDPLWDCPRLLLTPHCSGNMTLGYTVDRITALFLEDFENYCAGRPLQRRVDLKLGY